MKIPKKITPDYLKDTIVQVHFIPNIPPELILGDFNYLFKGTYKFIAGKRFQPPIQGMPSIIQENFYFVDTNEEVKIEITERTLTFNTLHKYIGWQRYFPLIQKTLDSLWNSKTIKSVNRLGLRYVSEFPEIRIFEKLKMGINLNIPNKTFQITQFRTEYIDDQFRVILNLSNDMLKKGPEIEKQSRFSLIDVDVISIFKEPESSLEQIVNIIDKSHFKQKTIFFSLLTDSFLNSLNPEY